MNWAEIISFFFIIVMRMTVTTNYKNDEKSTENSSS